VKKKSYSKLTISPLVSMGTDWIVIIAMVKMTNANDTRCILSLVAKLAAEGICCVQDNLKSK
jgi:hypothetical protein